MMVNVDSVGFFRGLRVSMPEGTEAGSRERRRAGRTRHELPTAQAACRQRNRIFASACAAAQPRASRRFRHVRILLVHGVLPPLAVHSKGTLRSKCHSPVMYPSLARPTNGSDGDRLPKPLMIT